MNLQKNNDLVNEIIAEIKVRSKRPMSYLVPYNDVIVRFMEGMPETDPITYKRDEIAMVSDGIWVYVGGNQIFFPWHRILSIMQSQNQPGPGKLAEFENVAPHVD